MHVDKLLNAARTNEAKLERMQAMELRLLDAASLTELCHLLIHDYRDSFALQAVHLFLFDWDGELSRFLADVEIAVGEGVQVVGAGDALELLSLCKQKPWLGRVDLNLHAKHLGAADNIASITLLPLLRQQRQIGLLVLGSEDSTRFVPNLGTEFLQRLAAVIAVCIENALNFERVRQLGLRDPLTRLYNRRYFLERVLQAMTIAARSTAAVACIYVDVDFFKRVNDQYGHPAGDAVLCEVAARIRQQLRAGEIVARLGGEEFAILLSAAELPRAAHIAERIRAAIESMAFELPSGLLINVSLSSGVAVWSAQRMPASVSAVDDLLQRADQALLAAKRAGRNQVVCDQT